MIVDRALDWRTAMTVDLPAIDQDGVVVSKYTLTDRDALMGRLDAMRHGRGLVKAGETITRLHVDGRLWMSDTPDEKRDHAEAYLQAEKRGGRVIINGLGLGMVVGAVLKLPQVEHVDVVEFDKRIVNAIGPHYASERCTIHLGDAHDIPWPTGARWTVAWHDIWPTISEENWPSMNRLHRRYGRRTDWQGSWSRPEVKRMIDQDRRWSSTYGY